MKRVFVIDSHTGGEPTRTVIGGGPELGGGSVAEQLKRFREQHDRFRSAVVNEPRGSDVVVGAMLVPASEANCATGVIFFNNVGYLGMCGHGMIGVVVTLAHMGRIKAGKHRVETPVGVVTATLHPDGSVSVQNVPSYRKAKGVKVNVPVELGSQSSPLQPNPTSGGASSASPEVTICGDVAWGGNWFFLVEDHGQELTVANVEKLTEFTWRVRQAINEQFPDIDHVELFGPAKDAKANSRNFVLCPGKAYDRSPCGTGTSAKLACLAADGKLREGEPWVQESIVGSFFTGSYTRRGEEILPTITGTAFVNSEATLLLDERDPFCWGFR
jgi:4-hydroxyproline epimerase